MNYDDLELPLYIIIACWASDMNIGILGLHSDCDECGECAICEEAHGLRRCVNCDLGKDCPWVEHRGNKYMCKSAVEGEDLCERQMLPLHIVIAYWSLMHKMKGYSIKYITDMMNERANGDKEELTPMAEKAIEVLEEGYRRAEDHRARIMNEDDLLGL